MDIRTSKEGRKREKERKLVLYVHHNITAYTRLFMYVGPPTKGGVSGVWGGEGILCRRQRALLIEICFIFDCGWRFFLLMFGRQCNANESEQGRGKRSK